MGALRTCILIPRWQFKRGGINRKIKEMRTRHELKTAAAVTSLCGIKANVVPRNKKRRYINHGRNYF